MIIRIAANNKNSHYYRRTTYLLAGSKRSVCHHGIYYDWYKFKED